MAARERLFTIQQACPLLGKTHPNTVRRLIRDKRLRAMRDGPRGHWVIPESAIDAYQRSLQTNTETRSTTPTTSALAAIIASETPRTRRTRRPALKVTKDWARK